MGLQFDLMCYLALETFSSLLVIHKVLGKKKVRSILYIFIMFFLQTAFLYYINIQNIDAIYTLIVNIIVLLYIYFQYGEGLIHSFFIFLIVAFTSIIIQLISVLPLIIVRGMLHNDQIEYGVNIIVVIISMIVYLYIPINKLYDFIKKRDATLKFICSLSFIIIFYLMLNWKINDIILMKDSMLVGIFLFVIGLVIYEWQNQIAIAKEKEKELKLSKLYDDSYKDLIDEISARQHAFKDHLNTIKSQHIAIKTYDELVKNQKEYIKEIDCINQNDDIGLLKLSDKILASFIYKNISRMKEKGIKVEYQIKDLNIKTKAMESELIECIGVLMKNAEEACIEPYNEVRIQIGMESDRLAFMIMNKHPRMTLEELVGIFQKGRTTKTSTEGRGYGLYNLKNIVNKNKGTILVENIEWEGENYIRFYLNL